MYPVPPCPPYAVDVSMVASGGIGADAIVSVAVCEALVSPRMRACICSRSVKGLLIICSRVNRLRAEIGGQLRMSTVSFSRSSDISHP